MAKASNSADPRRWLTDYRQAIESQLREVETQPPSAPAGATPASYYVPSRPQLGIDIRLLLMDVPPAARRLVPALLALQAQYQAIRDSIVDDDESDRKKPVDSLIAQIDALEARYTQWRAWVIVAACSGAVVAIGGLAYWFNAVSEKDPDPLGVWLSSIVALLGLVWFSALTRPAIAGLPSSYSFLPVVPPFVGIASAIYVIIGPADSPQAFSTAAILIGGSMLIIAWLLAETYISVTGDLAGDEFYLPEFPSDDDLHDVTGAGRRNVRAELAALARAVRARGRSAARQARWWGVTHLVVGGIGAGLSAAAAVTAVPATDVKFGWPVALALAAATLTGIGTALNPSRRKEEATLLAAKCEALDREVGVMRRVDWQDYSKPRDREALEDILTRYDQLLGLPELNSFWVRNNLRISPRKPASKDQETPAGNDQ